MCRTCKRLVEASDAIVWVGNYMVESHWTCNTCGAALYDWVWASSMAAAREARAVLAGEPLPNAGTTVPKLGKPVQLGLW